MDRVRSIFKNSIVAIVIMLSSVAVADDEDRFIMIENRSDKLAKVAAPGGKAVRVKPGEKKVRMDLQYSTRNGVDAKAWWVSNARQLCVIFVRYEGLLVIAGKKNIRCLGN